MNTINIDKIWSGYRKNKSKATKELLIEHYAPLVRIVAGRLGIYLTNYVELDDLIGYGVLGLIDAIDKFDHQKQVKFETYASLRIRGAIIDEIRKLDWVPRTLRKKQKDLTKVFEKLEIEHGQYPTQEQIMSELNIDKDEYYKLMQETNINSLVSIDENEAYLANIEDKTVPTPSEQIENKEIVDTLEMAVLELSEREQMVIKLYYYEELTLKEISLVLGVSESRVSQIHTKSIAKLKGKLDKYNIAFPL